MKVAEGKGGDYVLYVKIIKVMARIGRKRRVKSSMGSECKGLISKVGASAPFLETFGLSSLVTAVSL